jgi:hypothetical protein
MPIRRPQVQENIPVTTQHGHNGTHLVMIFSVPVENLTLSVAQADAMIAALQGVREQLVTHIAAAGAAARG